MGIPGSANPMLFGGVGAYQINQSLRFNSADSAYLNRTPASVGNRTTWTWSGWVKRSALGAQQALFNAGITAGQQISGIAFSSGGGVFDKLELWSGIQGVNTEAWCQSLAFYRDTSAWYHIVVAVDTTQSTAADRVKFYVNNSILSVAAYSAYSAYPSQNYSYAFNNTVAHQIGRDTVGTPSYLSGYLTEVHFIDGQALTPSSFGETDTITGVWKPKKYAGTYGTNGFYLKFEGSGIGTDSSGNGNTWTANNFSTSGTGTDVMSDTPTNNWCTLNPLNTYNNNTSNGNLTYSQTNSNNAVSQGTIGMPSGKWYWEINAANVGNGVYGITRYEYPTQAVFGCSNGYGTGFSPALNEAYINSSTASSSYCSSPSAPSSGTYMFAFDADARKFWMGVNGTWYTKTGGSAGDPGAGTNELFGTSDITAGVVYRALIGGSAVTTVSGDINFGQRSFSYTPPTGYKALNTANLPEPTIKKGSKYFDTVLYTGNGSTRTITGVGFQPDLVWIKRRDGAANHGLYDSVRGATKALVSSSTGAEVTDTGALTSFDADGFSLGAAVTTAPNVNTSGQTYVAWAWDANGAGSSNTAGTITSTVSANATAGFSIVTYTGTGANATVGHGLGVAPSMMIVKNRSAAAGWIVYHKFANASPATGGLRLNLTDAFVTYSLYWNNTEPNSSVFTLGTESQVNGNTNQMLAYCFSEVAGYSKFGSYTGNGSSDGPFVACNFRPRWVLTKRTDSTSAWYIHDTVRNTYNVCNNALSPDLADAEVTANNNVDILSNGFKLKTTGAWMNASGGTYVFAAFSETAFKFANAR